MNDPYIARGTRLGTCTLGGEAIIITPTDSNLYNLNSVATCIWEAANGQARVSQIVDERICNEFEIDHDTALTDALAFVADFTAKGLLRTSDVPIDPATVAQPFLESAHG
jgi:Coenzyme PQQ synthesis protein D (PqqD)